MPSETFLNLPEDKRERFLQAAINEFADNDYRNASISRICREVGIAKGSFYQYFADKQALFLYLIDLALAEKRALLGRVTIPEGADVFATLRGVFEGQAQFEFAHPRLAEVGYRALYGDLPFKNEMLETLQAQAKAGYGALVAQGIAEGSIDPAIDAETATYVIATLFGDLNRYLQRRLGLDPKTMMTRQLNAAEWAQANKLFDGLVQILEQGLGVKDKNDD